MKTCVLASGSKGNCTFVSSLSTNILIDLGTSCLYAEKKLKEINVDPSSINAIILTHTHVDHTSGIKIFMKKYPVKLYLTKKMLNELNALFPVDNYQIIEDDFQIQDITVKIIKTSHDTEDSNGYILESENKSVVYVTDTGYLNKKGLDRLKNRTVYVFESNHDVKMLMEGHYPYHIKQRILGDRGHLSNVDSAYYLSKIIGKDTKKIYLAHISQDNNTPLLALQTVKQKLKEENIPFDNIDIATQNERTELLEV